MGKITKPRAEGKGLPLGMQIFLGIQVFSPVETAIYFSQTNFPKEDQFLYHLFYILHTACSIYCFLRVDFFS